MLITREWIKKHGTGENGWTRKQLVVLGVQWPPEKGWLSTLVGRWIDADVAQAFERLGEERRRKLTRREVQNDLEW